ncbi:hypothetical protein [Crocosphaera chwakensis]|uniref:Uncharacterized protein n=1 Tax=Crocosphaera chwakensis CCY0110 TaxID=391612 RepID=A3IZ28_9CHRO|nr:hypothetical protein [Crocosphaera chwakensis]EAZ88267.1 hypothetical protein CY0110_06619 [Crocosphaera chwakensis CCY0110]
MNRLPHKITTITITFISLITLVSSIKPILAHSGHDHSQPESQNTKIEEENILSSPTSETKQPQKLENKTINVTLQETNQLNFIPQTSEIIFLLLVASPVVLKIIKQKL